MALTGADLLSGKTSGSAAGSRDGVTGRELLGETQHRSNILPQTGTGGQTRNSDGVVMLPRLNTQGTQTMRSRDDGATRRHYAQMMQEEEAKQQPAALFGNMVGALQSGKTSAGLDLMNTAQMAQFSQSNRQLGQKLAMDQAEKALSAGSAYTEENWGNANKAMRALEKAYPELTKAYNAATAISTPSRVDAAAAEQARKVQESVPADVLETYRGLANLPGMSLNAAANLVDTTFVGGGHQALGSLYSGAAWLDEAVTRNLLGQEDYTSGARAMAEGEYEEAAQKMASNTAGMPEWYRKVSDLGQSAGAMLMNSMMAGTATAGAAPAMTGAAAAEGTALASTGEKAASALSSLGTKAYNNLLNNAGLYMNSAGAAGQGIYQAYQEGADLDEQGAYGLLAGASEYASEKLFGGNPLFDQNAGAVNRLVGKVTQNPAVLSALSSAPAELFGEGLEEVITAFADPVWQWMTYKQGEDIDWATFDELADNFLSGVALAGLMQGGQAVINGVRMLPVAGQQVTTQADMTSLESQLRTAAEQTIEAYEQQAEAAPIRSQNTQSENARSVSRPSAATEAAESTVVNTNPAKHTPQEQAIIDEYQAAVDDNVVSFVERVRNLQNRDYRNRIKMPIAEVTERAASDLQRLTGVDTTGFEHVLTGRAVDHIENRHGANGEADHSMRDVNDIGRIGYVLENYDSVQTLEDANGNPKGSADFRNADGTRGRMVRFLKKVNGTYYVVEAVTDAKARQIGIVSAYMQKNGGSTDQVLNMPGQNQTRSVTPEAPVGALTSTKETSLAGDGWETKSNPAGRSSEVSSEGEGSPSLSQSIPQSAENVNQFVPLPIAGQENARAQNAAEPIVGNELVNTAVAEFRRKGWVSDDILIDLSLDETAQAALQRIVGHPVGMGANLGASVRALRAAVQEAANANLPGNAGTNARAQVAPRSERVTQKPQNGQNASRKEGGAVETWEHARQRQGPRSEFFENTLRRTVGKETLNQVAADLNTADQVPSDVTWSNRSDSGELFKYTPRTEAEQNAWAQEQIEIAMEEAQRRSPSMTEAEARWEANREMIRRLEDKQGWDAFDVKLAAMVEDYLVDAYRSTKSEIANDFFPEIDDADLTLAKTISDFLRMETKQISGAGATLQAVAERTRSAPEQKILSEVEKLLEQAKEEGNKRLTDDAYMDTLTAAIESAARIKRAQPEGPTALETVQEALSPADLAMLELVQHREGKEAEAQREAILNKLAPETRETYDRALAEENAARRALIDLIQENSTRRGTNRLVNNDKGVSRALKGALEHQGYDFLRALASEQTIDLARDYTKIAPGRKVKSLQVLAHLLNARTGLRNQIGNTVFSAIDTLAVEPGVLLDMAISKRTGTRSRSADMSRFSPEKRAGIRSAGEKAYIQTALDVALDSQTNAYGQGARRNFKMNAGPVSRFLSTMSKWLGYELNVTDARAKGGHEAEAMRQLRALQENGKLRPDAQDADLQEAARQEALYRTFQDDSRIGQISKGAHDLLNRAVGTKEFGLGDVVVPYAKTPGNLVSRAVEYSPVGAVQGAAQILKTLKQGQNASIAQQRAAVDTFSRGLTGTGLIAMFTALSLAGLMGSAGDEDDKNAAAMNAAGGLSGTQWNLDATLRWLKGEDTQWKDGDTLIGISFLEPLSSQMALGTAIASEMQDAEDRGEEVKPGDAAKAGLDGIMEELANMPAFTGLSSIVDAYRYSDAEGAGGKALDAALSTAASIPASFVPAPVRQIAQGTDDKYRDLYSADTGNAFLDTVENAGSAFANNVPGLRQLLPVKQDNFGRDKTQTGNTALNLANATVMPGSINTYKSTAVEDEIRSLAAATGDVGVYPNRKAADSFTYDGTKYQLNYGERRQFQTVYGESFQNVMEGMLESDYYRGLSAADKAKMVQTAKNYASDAAKADYLDGKYTSSMLEGVSELESAGLGFSDWYEWHEKKAALSGEDAQEQILSQLEKSGLDDEQAAAVYANACGYPVSEKKAEAGRKAGIDSDTLTLWRYRFDQAEARGDGNEEKRQLLYQSSLPAAEKNAIDDIFLNDGVYIPREKDVDYSSDETFWITQMSDSGQQRYETWVQGQLSAKEWYDLYTEYSGESKTNIVAALQQQGWNAGDAQIIAGWIKGKVK